MLCHPERRPERAVDEGSLAQDKLRERMKTKHIQTDASSEPVLSEHQRSYPSSTPVLSEAELFVLRLRLC